MKLKDISSQFPPPSPTHPVGFFSGLLRTVRSNIGSPVFRKGRRKSEIIQTFLSFPSPLQSLAGSIFPRYINTSGGSRVLEEVRGI